MKYFVIYEKTATGFSAYVHDLDGMRQDGAPFPFLQPWRQRRWRYSFLKNCALLARLASFRQCTRCGEEVYGHFIVSA